MNYKYQIIKEATDNQKSQIRKSGVTIDFTMEQVAEHYNNLKKVQKELKSKLSYEKAKLSNIVEHNPIVNKITDEKEKLAIFMAVEAETLIKKIQKDLEEYTQAIKEYDNELFEIEKQTGIALKEKK